MRFKVLAFILIGGLLGAGMLLVLKKTFPRHEDRTSSALDRRSPSEPGATNTLSAKGTERGPFETSSAETGKPTDAQTLVEFNSRTTAGLTAPKAAPWSTPAEKTAYIKSTIRKLDDLGAENDAASLAVIVSELTNSI